MSSDCFALPSLEHYSSIFFFTATATTEIYTLSLHDALPICVGRKDGRGPRQSSGLALNDAQLLPVGRASAGVERGESGSSRSRSHGGRGVQAGAPRLRRTSERRLIMPNRAVTVYWSTT